MESLGIKSPGENKASAIKGKIEKKFYELSLDEYMKSNNLTKEDVLYVINLFHRKNDSKQVRFWDIAGLEKVK